MYNANLPMTMNSANAALAEGLRLIELGETSFDLAAIEAVDSSALAVLIAWQRAAQARGGRVDFSNPPDALTSLAQLYGVSEILNLPEHEIAQESH